MRNILFTPPNDEKILNGDKDMSARCWLAPPPKVGDLVTASTGYKKETRFAILRVTGVHEWELGFKDTNAEEVTGLTKQEIAEREGFKDSYAHDPDTWLTDWDAFMSAYYALNAQKLGDDNRTNYFIMFELVEPI